MNSEAAKTQVVVAFARLVLVAIRRAHVTRVVVPRAATHHPGGSFFGNSPIAGYTISVVIHALALCGAARALAALCTTLSHWHAGQRNRHY